MNGGGQGWEGEVLLQRSGQNVFAGKLLTQRYSKNIKLFKRTRENLPFLQAETSRLMLDNHEREREREVKSKVTWGVH